MPEWTYGRRALLRDSKMFLISVPLCVSAAGIGDLLPPLGCFEKCFIGGSFVNRCGFDSVVQRGEIVVDAGDARNDERLLTAEFGGELFGEVGTIVRRNICAIPGG